MKFVIILFMGHIKTYLISLIVVSVIVHETLGLFAIEETGEK